MWPFDKLSVINTAAIQTGNNGVNVADDGSEEWDHGSAAYELALPYAIEQKNWKFETTVAVLTRRASRRPTRCSTPPMPSRRTPRTSSGCG
jgi:hypothetical protein